MKHGRIAIELIAASVALSIAAHRLPAQVRGFDLAAANYNFLIASGFLCGPSGADDCPAMAETADRKRLVKLSGAGTLSAADKSASAAGSFAEITPAGQIMVTGVWTATGVVSFQPYGIAPFELQRDYPRLRTAGMLGMRGPAMPRMAGPLRGPLAAGGLAVIRIRLLPDAGAPQDAVLRINCAKGKVPPEEPSDGFKLAITGGPSFDVPVRGRTVFLLLGTKPKKARKSLPAQQP
jgi:hypothetical protein